MDSVSNCSAVWIDVQGALKTKFSDSSFDRSYLVAICMKRWETNCIHVLSL